MSKQTFVEETIEQFLARGGQKQIFPYIAPVNKQEVSSNVVRSIMNLSEGEFFFCVEKKKENKPIKIDDSKLPADLLEKLRSRGIKING